jgi:hypothetical protein
MARVQARADDARLIEAKTEPAHVAPFRARLGILEKLVCAIEDELCDEALSDEQKLQNIGERVAAVMDGR